MQEQAYEDAGLLSYEYQELESSGDYTPGSVSSGKFRGNFRKISEFYFWHLLKMFLDL